MLRNTFVAITVFIFFGVVACTRNSERPHSDDLSLGATGIATPQPHRLTVAAPLTNLTGTMLEDVQIKLIRLSTASIHTKLPIRIKTIASHGTVVIQANFDRGVLVAGKNYDLVVEGVYRKGIREKDEGHTEKFRLHQSVILPPISPGSAKSRTTPELRAHRTKGAPYPHRSPQMDKERNMSAPIVPTTKSVPEAPTTKNTKLQTVKLGDPPPIVFDTNSAVGINGAGQNCSGDSAAACAEPSGASGGGVTLVSANWGLAYSTNGGGSFNVVDPTTIFPADSIGFCCDQIVQYARSINRFIWLLQGTGYRLAVASPASIKNSNGTAWTYWNLKPSLFGKCTGPDYPDLSVGDNALYISWDARGGSTCSAGFQVIRTSLAGLQSGGTITLNYTDPANAPVNKVWGEHLTQNTGNEIFWAGHNGNSTLTVYSWKEGSNTYFWRDTAISPWANNAPTSTTPDGQDWLAKNFNGPGGNSFPRNGIIGAARYGNELWFGWTAGTNRHFKQAHIEIVTLDRNKNFQKIQQIQVWNNDYAFAYPAFSTNACTGELGMSFEYGGNGHYENHVVGFWGDFVAYITTNSDKGTDRFGDYVTIRRAPKTKSNPGNLFTAFGWGFDKQTPPPTGKRTDVRYVLFGRPPSSCQLR